MAPRRLPRRLVLLWWLAVAAVGGLFECLVSCAEGHVASSIVADPDKERDSRCKEAPSDNDFKEGHKPRPLRVLAVAMAFRGHAMPMFELTDELLRRGHEVRMAIQDEGLPWYAEHRCLESNFTSSCCQGYRACPPGELISLGGLIHGGSAVRKHLYSVVDDSSLIHGIWGVLRDLYLGQATRTVIRLCRFLQGAIDANVTSCNFMDPFNDVEQTKGHDIGPDELVNPDTWFPDVILSDIGAIGVAEISDLFNVPLVLNSPTLFFSFGDPQQSSSRHLPGWGSGFSRHMGFLDRCINVVYPRLMAAALTPDFVLLNQLLENMGLPSFHSQYAIFQGRHMLVDSVIGFEYPRFLEPTVHFIGLLQRGNYHGLPGQVPQREVSLGWLAEQVAQDRPIVVVALGSIGIVSTDLMQVFLHGMRNFSVMWIVSTEPGREPSGSAEVNAANFLTFLQKVRPQLAHASMNVAHHDLIASFIDFCRDTEHLTEWHLDLCPVSRARTPSQASSSATKADEDRQDEGLQYAVPNHFFVHEQTSYLPLTELLSQPNIRATVSYCGLSIVQESIRAQTPLVCLPLFADQFDVAARVADLGVGVTINRERAATEEDVEEALRIEYPRSVLVRASRLFRNLDGKRLAGDVIEYVARRPPQSLFRSKNNSWPFFRALNYDIIALVLSAIVFIASLCIMLLKGIRRGLRFNSVPHEPCTN